MTFLLPPLPFKEGALAPYISEKTIKFHYEKHHQTYVDKVNELIVNTKYEDMRLEQIIQSAKGKIFNNAAQSWNHAFFWHCLSPNHNQQPGKKLTDLIVKSFSSFANFKSEFSETAVNLFGSGWVWLVVQNH